MKLKFAGANNPLYLIRNGELEVFKTNKFAIGSFTDGENNYETFELDLKEGDKIYAFSDGYPDQFGGDRGKKFMYKNSKYYKYTLYANICIVCFRFYICVDGRWAEMINVCLIHE